MGQQTERVDVAIAERQLFMKSVLVDLTALERMLDEGQFETGIRRIGAEQELVFTDARWRPAPVGPEVLDRLNDDRFTTELSLYNIEFNLPPLSFDGDCLRRLEGHMNEAMDLVHAVSEELNVRPILVGILPTLRKSDLGLESITPRPRYLMLVKALRDLRGEAYEFRFTGVDELVMRHESVMLEACNTSSQFHLQVAPHEFARMFNIAQLVAAPVLAVAVNSPILFGSRLWKETRIALFQQAIDTRRPSEGLEHRSGRVRFGEGWVKDSVLELFRDDVSRFRAVLGEQIDEDAMAVLEHGGVPKLKALQLHNGTVYRWNRACYGVTDGVPHLRVENRVLPSGPTILDEVANAAFWYGLMLGIARTYADIRSHIDFDDAKGNFLLAARVGLDARLRWLDGSHRCADELIVSELVPLAREGLRSCDVDEADIERYLGVIEQRATSRRTGAWWYLESFKALDGRMRRFQVLDTLVANAYRHQMDGRPVHEWPIAEARETLMSQDRYHRVDQFMTTDVFVVHVDDVIDLAASVMDWKHVRHVPVEDDQRRLVGLISYRQLLRFLARDLPHGKTHPVPVREVMQPDPITIAPETSTLEAMEIMRRESVPCLPVVKGERIVGILTERDFIPVAAQLLEDRLRQ